MSLFQRFFQKKTPATPVVNLRFGRYTDIYKTPERYDAWDESLEAFDRQDYLKAYEEFFQYLRDGKEDNVRWNRTGDTLEFEFYQGSKKITGTATRIQLKAEAKVVGVTGALNEVLMRQLLVKNFELEYCRFALDEDQNLTVVFDTYTLDGSPFKLYYALREMAIQADKYDDLLVERFSDLSPINTGHTADLSEAEKEAKYHFSLDAIRTRLEQVRALEQPLEGYPGGIAYMLLSLCYKLDYLVKPEGYMMEALERIHRSWYAQDDTSPKAKNTFMQQEFRKLLVRPQIAYYSEFYRVISTFGIVPSIDRNRVESIIEAELPVMDWYHENGYIEAAMAIPEYIVGYCLFSFALPKPVRDFFHLYYRILENDYFQALGYKERFINKEKKRLNSRAIRNAIQAVVRENKEAFSGLKPDVSSLDFRSKVAFTKSYLLMVKGLRIIEVA